jgi:cytoskeletal protein CcmA (bactofilin family)
MFRNTEESEWTRFSRALSGREREEPAAAAESESAPTPAASPPTPPPILRQPTSETSVASRSGNRAPTPESSEDEVESTTGERTTIDGTFKSDNSIRVRGTVQGEIESKRTIWVEKSANVTAKVTAESVTVSGQINGQIFSSGRVEIRPSGRVTGEISAGTLIMQEGAFFEGNLKMTGRSGSSNEGAEPVRSLRR